jgi:hypothetical protein
MVSGHCVVLNGKVIHSSWAVHQIAARGLGRDSEMLVAHRVIISQ